MTSLEMIQLDKDRVINWRLVNGIIKNALQSTVDYIPIDNFINDNQSVESPHYPYVVLKPDQQYVQDEFTHYMTNETFDHVLGVTAVDPDNDTALQIADTMATLIRDPKYSEQLRENGIYVVEAKATMETGIHIRQFNTNYQYYFEITFRIKRNGNITRNPINTIQVTHENDGLEQDFDISNDEKG